MNECVSYWQNLHASGIMQLLQDMMFVHSRANYFSFDHVVISTIVTIPHLQDPNSTVHLPKALPTQPPLPRRNPRPRPRKPPLPLGLSPAVRPAPL
jgi:hypothetical protein